VVGVVPVHAGPVQSLALEGLVLLRGAGSGTAEVMDTSNESLISSAGGSLLLATARATGLDEGRATGTTRRPFLTHGVSSC